MADAGLQTRPIAPADFAAVLGIYNHYVVTSHCTFDDAPFTIGQRVPWFAQFSENGLYQCLVAADGGEVLGYACSVPFKPKPGYISSAELSVYVAPGGVGQQIGTTLYQQLLPRLETKKLHRLYAGIALPNDASMALHEKFGFRQTAHFTEVGIKYGKFWDVAWLERPMPSNDATRR